uniref:Transcriptional regulator n=1 Tax=Parastrongyloides trichosuri TaxID=131310 RepID=A0A0N5A0W4_PARTI
AAGMGEIQASLEEARAPRSRTARQVLLRRLADVVSLPASRINAFERAVAGDLLVDVLRPAPLEERRRVSLRLAPLGELPDALKRLLIR